MFRVESRIAEQISQCSRCFCTSSSTSGAEVAVQVAGDMRPNVFAFYDHGNHLRLGATRFNCGARFFCNIMRARCNRTLTEAMLMPIASAASLTLSPSTSQQEDFAIDRRQTGYGLLQ